MDYLNAWLIAAVAAVACLAFFFLLTRRIGSLLVRILLRCLAAVWLLLPAPVPEYFGQYAPAFVVLVFEGLLQSDGDPALALRILLWGSAAVIVLVCVWFFVFGRQRDPSDQSNAQRTGSGNLETAVHRSATDT